MNEGYGSEFAAIREPDPTSSVSSRSTEDRRPWVGIAANAGSGRGSGRRRVISLVTELNRSGLETRVAWTPAEARIW